MLLTYWRGIRGLSRAHHFQGSVLNWVVQSSDDAPLEMDHIICPDQGRKHSTGPAWPLKTNLTMAVQVSEWRRPRCSSPRVLHWRGYLIPSASTVPSESPPKMSKWVVEMYQWEALPPLAPGVATPMQTTPPHPHTPKKVDDSITKMANNQKSLSIRVEVTI